MPTDAYGPAWVSSWRATATQLVVSSIFTDWRIDAPDGRH